MLADTAAEDRVDFERGMSYLPRVTLLLIAASVGVFAWEIATGALESVENIVRAGALHRASVADGEAWRLLSATLLHGGAGHLVGNCIGLYIVGMACEHAFGSGGMAKVAFASALGGSLLSVAAHPGPSVGASGIVFGVMGAVAAFLHRHRHDLEIRDLRVGIVLLAWAVYAVITGFLTPFVDNFAHIGGFLAGGAVALALEPAIFRRTRPA